AVVGLIPVAIGAATLWLMARGRRTTAGYVLGVGAVAFSAMFHGYFLVRVDQHQQNHLLLQAIRQHSDHPEVGAYDCMESTLVFYGGWPIRDLVSKTSPMDMSSKQSFLSPSDGKITFDVVDFLTNKADRFVITTKHRYSGIQPYLPTDVVVL